MIVLLGRFGQRQIAPSGANRIIGTGRSNASVDVRFAATGPTIGRYSGG